MFLRILVLLGLLIVAWWIFRKREKLPPPPSNAPGPAPAPRALAKAEPMVDCVRCGLHFPASEALRDVEAHVYCCAEHRAQGPRAAR